MLPLLAALPAIFSTVSKVSNLFGKGKTVVEQVTGKPSEASSPDELQEEVESLTPEQQAQWAQTMQQKIDLYKTENDRLDIEIGRITPELQSKLTPEAANKIAIMRQTTRPWAVRMMVHYTFFPFYLVLFDAIQLTITHWFGISEVRVFKSFNYVFGTLTIKDIDASILDKVTSFMSQPQHLTLAADMYMNSIGWVIAVIISYMTLREIGKAKGTSGDELTHQQNNPSGAVDLIQGGLGLVNKVKAAFGKI
jgi:hypothetical protein